MSQKTAKRERSNAARVAPVRPPSATRGRGPWLAAGAIGLVVLVVAGFVVAKALQGGTSAATAGTTKGALSTPAPAAVVRVVTTLPAATFDAVGRGSVLATPFPVNGSPISAGGKPLVVYLGAEYCPYCAAQRWAVVAALSRFGTFTGLGATHSSTVDVYPDTRTFSFHGSSYTSSYISFSPVETASNVVEGNHYAPLDKPTALENSLIQQWDVPPYVPSSSIGAIPFIDYGNRFVSVGAQYQPQVLQGLTMQQIAAALRDPKSTIAQNVLGSANSITATICRLTGNKPAAVCTSSGVRAYARGAS